MADGSKWSRPRGPVLGAQQGGRPRDFFLRDLATAEAYVRRRRADADDLFRDLGRWRAMEDAWALSHLPGAYEVAEQVRHLGLALAGLQAQLGRPPGPNLAREMAEWQTHLANIDLLVRPRDRMFDHLPGGKGSGPASLRGGDRVRFTGHIATMCDRQLVSVSVLMALAMLAGLPEDGATKDPEEMERRRDIWKKNLKRAMGGPDRRR